MSNENYDRNKLSGDEKYWLIFWAMFFLAWTLVHIFGTP